MMYIVFSILFFIFTIYFQFFINKYIFSKINFKFDIFVSYLFCANVVHIFFVVLLPVQTETSLINWWNFPLHFTTIFFYSLLTILYAIFSTVVYLNDTSPSAQILDAIGQSKKLTEKQLLKNFTWEQLVNKKLLDMETSGYIEKKHQHYYILKKGSYLMQVINLYKFSLGIHE